MPDIVVPFYEQAQLAVRCLKSVEISCGSRNRVIVVDDGSSEAQRELLTASIAALALDVVVLVHPVNRGFREAATTGLQAVSGSHAILLNTDTIVTPDFDLLLLDAFCEPHVAAAAPVSGHPTDLYQYRPALAERAAPDRGDAFRVVAHMAARARRAGRRLTSAPYLTGMCLALDRSALEAAGGFDSSYRHGYFEDLALSCRLRSLGYRLVVREDCFVYHEGHASYRTRPQDEKIANITHNFTLFSTDWGHLPEHADLVSRMELAGKAHPI